MTTRREPASSCQGWKSKRGWKSSMHSQTPWTTKENVAKLTTIWSWLAQLAWLARACNWLVLFTWFSWSLSMSLWMSFRPMDESTGLDRRIVVRFLMDWLILLVKLRGGSSTGRRRGRNRWVLRSRVWSLRIWWRCIQLQVRRVTFSFHRVQQIADYAWL